MKKKLVLVLLLATLIAGGAFAQISMSAGFGGTFTADFARYNWTALAKQYMQAEDYDDYDQNIVGGGFFAYFDATYAMASLGMGFYGISPVDAKTKADWTKNQMSMSLTTFDISIYGKYPFVLGPVTVFPLLGMEFKIALAQDWNFEGKRYAWNDPLRVLLRELSGSPGTVGQYWNTTWFKFGVGADIPLAFDGKLYLRPMFLYGFGTLPKEMSQDIAAWNLAGVFLGGKMVDGILSGLDVKIAVGYKLF